MSHGSEIMTPCPGRAPCLRALAATLAFVPALLAGPPAASQPAAPDSPLVGLRVHHDLIPECVKLLEDGHAPDAIGRLSNATRKVKSGSRAQLNELRLGLGMVVLRTGDVKQARQILHP